MQIQLRSVLIGGAIVISGFVIPACSSSSDDSDDACTRSGKRVCERACACGSSECKTGYANSFGSFTTFTWSDRSDCEAGYAGSRCKNGGAGIDFDACLSAIDSTACNGDVFVVPASCEAPKDGG